MIQENRRLLRTTRHLRQFFFVMPEFSNYLKLLHSDTCPAPLSRVCRNDTGADVVSCHKGLYSLCVENCVKALTFLLPTSRGRSNKGLDFNYFMQEALQEAAKARTEAEVPVGAIVVNHYGDIVARDHNRCISLRDPTAHAEMLAIRQASKVVNNYRLNQSTLFVTIEPCLMCMGAILNARIERLVFGAFDRKFGASCAIKECADAKKSYHKLKIISGIMEEECKQTMQDFFRERR
jgi:tRNA(adenine34) deaminase